MTAQALGQKRNKLTKSNTTSASQKFWDKQARKYAKSKIADEAGYRRSLARTQDFLKPSDEVLEIGCGTGTTALHHAANISHITGTDISPEMVKIANEKAADSGQLNAEFVTSSAETLPLAENAFDVTMAHNLFHLVDDLEASLSAAYRVTKPGGLFISKTPCLGEMNGLMRKTVFPIMQWWYGIEKLHTFTMVEFEKAITRAGFDIEHIEFHGTKGKDTRPFVVARKV